MKDGEITQIGIIMNLEIILSVVCRKSLVWADRVSKLVIEPFRAVLAFNNHAPILLDRSGSIVGSLTRRAWLDPAIAQRVKRNTLTPGRRCVCFNTLHAGVYQLILLCLVVLACGLASAQQFPTLTYSTPVFNQVTDNLALSPVPTPGVPLSQNTCSTANSKCAIQNTGMGTHLIRFCSAAPLLGSLNMWLESSLDNSSPPVNWKQISPEIILKAGDAGCYDIKACGYYSFVRLHMANAGGASITAQYAGIATNCDAAGTLTNQGGALPVTFNPANAGGSAGGGSSLTGLSLVKSAPVPLIGLIAGVDSVLYGLSVSNPNNVSVFASIQCNATPLTIFQWQIPANDHRPLFELPPQGIFCSFQPLGICSTSSTAAVDPANSCLFNAAFKNVMLIHSKVNNAGTTLVSNPVTPN